MPELPEVETVKRGLSPLLQGQTIEQVWHSHHNMRHPWPEDFDELIGLSIVSTHRRAKYLLLQLSDDSHLVFHLGMTGVIRVLSCEGYQLVKHDHCLIHFPNQQVLVFNDPRRFGSVVWVKGPLEAHPMFARLGPEPLENEFDATYLTQQAKGKKTTIKSLIMNNQVVVGVGNIYASEALFLSGIHPHRPAGRISSRRLQGLVDSIQHVLKQAVDAGGTTLKDFRNSDGQPGYFQQTLNVYGREGEKCPRCEATISVVKTCGRSTFLCSKCQR